MYTFIQFHLLYMQTRHVCLHTPLALWKWAPLTTQASCVNDPPFPSYWRMTAINMMKDWRNSENPMNPKQCDSSLPGTYSSHHLLCTFCLYRLKRSSWEHFETLRFDLRLQMTQMCFKACWPIINRSVCVLVWVVSGHATGSSQPWLTHTTHSI